MSDIRQWLEELGLGQYADAFEENAITPELLMTELSRTSVSAVVPAIPSNGMVF